MLQLLGQRWKNDGWIRINCDMYPTPAQNLQKISEQLTELYWEAKRAP
jgi:hypothetical protein